MEGNQVMRIRSKLLGTATALVAGAVVSLWGTVGVTAQELPAGFDAAVFTGAAGGITPPVQTVGGTGTYSFSGSCTVAVGDSEVGGAPEVPSSCTITSTGSFTNVVCGTGLVTGSATINEGAPDPSTISANYTIVFVGSVGVVVSTSVTESDSPPPAAAAGVVQILPTTGNCVTPVSQFAVSGVLALPS
jgi:hypothetical protein